MQSLFKFNKHNIKNVSHARDWGTITLMTFSAIINKMITAS